MHHAFGSMRVGAAWVLLMVTVLPLPLFVGGGSAANELDALPYSHYVPIVAVGSVVIGSLCVVSLVRSFTDTIRAVASGAAWGLVWASPLVFTLIAVTGARGVLVATLLSLGGITVSILSTRRPRVAPDS